MDIFSIEKRSELMRSIKGKNTKPEIIVRKALHEFGFRFRLHDKTLPGTPDIILKKHKTVIFVNGCFWHGHESCRRGTSLPKTNVDYWHNKIISNKERDKRKTESLKNVGWHVINIYECELKTKNYNNTITRVLTSIVKQT